MTSNLHHWLPHQRPRCDLLPPTLEYDRTEDSSHGSAFAGDWQTRRLVPNPEINKAIGALRKIVNARDEFIPESSLWWSLAMVSCRRRWCWPAYEKFLKIRWVSLQLLPCPASMWSIQPPSSLTGVRTPLSGTIIRGTPNTLKLGW
jgi:hypothetical protein